MKRSCPARIFPFIFIILVLQFLSAVGIQGQDLKPAIFDALQAGDTARAVNFLNQEIEIDKGYHLNYYTLGLIHFYRQQYSEARERFEQALDKKSKHHESLYYLGRCLIFLGEYDDAEERLQEGLRKSRELKAPFENGIGLLDLARQDYQKADRQFRKALAESEAAQAKELTDLKNTRLSDEERQAATEELMARYARENAEYHINLGDANFYQGVPSLAVIEYEKALEVDTGSLDVYFHWAEACLDMKDYTCAMEKLRVVLQKDSTHAAAWMKAGGIYFKAALSTRSRDERKARFFDAIGAYQKYLELSQAKPDSAHVRVFFEVAMAYANVGGAEEAAENFEKVLSIPYEPRDIYFHYGKALWGVQDFVKSGEMLLKHIEWLGDADHAAATKIKEVELYQYLGDAYYYREAKDFNEAIVYYRKSLDANPDQTRLTYNLAVAYHNEKQYALALEYYQKRIDQGIDSSEAGIYKNAGYCALNIANQGEADEEMENLDEEGEEAEPAEGGIDPNLDYYEVAVSYMEKYLEIHPQDTRVLLLVANTCLYQLADCASGVESYKRLLEVDPKSCEAKKALGYAYFGGICTKNYTKALGYLRDAYGCVSAEKGACSDADLVLWIAQCYHLRAVEKSKDKAASSADFKNANEWYVKCLNCDSSIQECKKGRDDTSFEF